MLKEILWICFYCMTIFHAGSCLAEGSMTKRKCAIYPTNHSPLTKNYALIEYNENKAILYTYFSSPFSNEFYLLKSHYKFLAKSKNDPHVLIYLYPENTAILAIDTVRQVASQASTLVSIMPSNINDQEQVLFNKKIKLSAEEKTGGESKGYYCNIDQDIELPAWVGEATDNYDNS